MRIVDVVLDSIILTNGPHTDTMCAVAIDVLDEDIGGVGFGAEAIITNVDPGIANSQPINVVRVPTIGVFWEILLNSASLPAGTWHWRAYLICRKVFNNDLVINNILTGNHEVGPAR